jgi:D-sedoheptulose 7-phosphate isomerase
VNDHDKNGGLEERYREATSRADFADRYLDYMASLLGKIDREAVARILDAFLGAAEAGRTLYLLGNGGSAAIASHMANDLAIGTRADGHPPIRAISLCDNLALLTALANDEGYERIFVDQLDGHLHPGDVVVALSVSGNSPNVLEAVRYAREVGATTVGCTGFDGGELRRAVDLPLHLPTPRGEYGPVEDMFAVLDHLTYTYLRMLRRGRLT